MNIQNLGFEIFFDNLSKEFQNKADALVCRLHWILLNHNFKLLNKEKKLTELLSKDYNFEKEKYVLTYVKQNKNYYLNILLQNGKMIIKFQGDKANFTKEVLVDNYVTNDYKNFEKAYKNLHEFDDSCSDLLKDICPKPNFSTNNTKNMDFSQNQLNTKNMDFSQNQLNTKNTDINQTQPNSKSSDQNYAPQKINIVSEKGLDTSVEDYSSLRNPNIHQNPDNFPFDPSPSMAKNCQQPRFPNRAPSIGRGDLDPFGSSPGMFFDPAHNMGQSGTGGFPFDPSRGLPNSERLPRGVIPPGARFDPFGPGNPFPEPKPDHMQPPNSDAYM